MFDSARDPSRATSRDHLFRRRLGYRGTPIDSDRCRIRQSGSKGEIGRDHLALCQFGDR